MVRERWSCYLPGRGPTPIQRGCRCVAPDGLPRAPVGKKSLPHPDTGALPSLCLKRYTEEDTFGKCVHTESCKTLKLHEAPERFLLPGQSGLESSGLGGRGVAPQPGVFWVALGRFFHQCFCFSLHSDKGALTVVISAALGLCHWVRRWCTN